MKSFFKLSFAVFVLTPYVHLRSGSERITVSLRRILHREAVEPRLHRRFSIR